MDTVLTLNIDQDVADGAAIYATHAKKTLSQVVEEYLASISAEGRDAAVEPLGPITTRLTGIIRLDKDVDHRDLLTTALMEKYL